MEARRTEVQGWLWVQHQPGIYKTLTQNRKKNQKYIDDLAVITILPKNMFTGPLSMFQSMSRWQYQESISVWLSLLPPGCYRRGDGSWTKHQQKSNIHILTSNLSSLRLVAKGQRSDTFAWILAEMLYCPSPQLPISELLRARSTKPRLLGSRESIVFYPHIHYLGFVKILLG